MKVIFSTKLTRLHVWSAVSIQLLTTKLNLGWEQNQKNTTTSKILSCLSIDLHLTKDNLGVTMLRSTRFTGDGENCLWAKKGFWQGFSYMSPISSTRCTFSQWKHNDLWQWCEEDKHFPNGFTSAEIPPVERWLGYECHERRQTSDYKCDNVKTKQFTGHFPSCDTGGVCEVVNLELKF